MKVKKLLFLAVILLSVFLIYLSTMDRKVYYLVLGDGLTASSSQTSYSQLLVSELTRKSLLECAVDNFVNPNHRITDVLRDIEDNERVTIGKKEYTLKHALIKADLVTLSVGLADIASKLQLQHQYQKEELYNYIDELMKDMDQLLERIREYCKEDVLVIGYYNPFTGPQKEVTAPYYEYANQKLKNLVEKHEMEWVDILSTFAQSEHNINSFDIYPTSAGNQIIYQTIEPILRNTLYR